MHDPASPSRHVYAFGPYRLDQPEHRLLRDEQTIPLSPKAFDLLVALVSRAGHLVTKEQLLQEVWPGTFVEEANLSYTVSLLRKALGDEREPHRYVETVPKRGYRFIGVIDGARTGNRTQNVSTSRCRSSGRRPYLQASRRQSSLPRQVTVRSSAGTFSA